jgi:type IV pilus assembly protein PilO
VPLLPTDQKDQGKIAVAIVAAALAVAYWNFPYAARAAELAETRDRVERLESANERGARDARRGSAPKLVAEAARARAALDGLRRLVPTVHEVPALLEEVSTAARRAGLDLGGVTPEPVLRGDDFDTHRYKLTVVGSYHALTTFLANVGSLPRIVAPVTFELQPAVSRSARVKLSRDPAAPAPLQAMVTIQAYVAHTAEAQP